MEPTTWRAWWAQRQGLPGGLAGHGPAEVLRRTGWARTVGSANPYLTLFARAGIDRGTADRAAEAVEICELPSARGCTYLLPAADFALGLAAGAAAPRAELVAAIKHLDVTEAEIDRLSGDVLTAVTEADEPLTPQALRERLGDAVRSLGEAGRKRGVSSTLPLALGLLQSSGELRRVPIDGRLDRQRYGYRRWTPSPLAGAETEPDRVAAELARRYFDWAGPATLSHFRWFSGLSAAIAEAELAEIDSAGWLAAAAGRRVRELHRTRRTPVRPGRLDRRPAPAAPRSRPPARPGRRRAARSAGAEEAAGRPQGSAMPDDHRPGADRRPVGIRPLDRVPRHPALRTG